MLFELHSKVLHLSTYKCTNMHGHVQHVKPYNITHCVVCGVKVKWYSPSSV